MSDIIQIGPQAESGLRKLGKDIKTVANNPNILTNQITIQKPKGIKAIVYLGFTSLFVAAIIYVGFFMMYNPEELISKIPIIAGIGIASAFGMTLFSTNE